MLRVVVVITLVLAARAHADSAKAKVLSDEAEALVAKGDLVGAAAKYREAYREEPIPEHMCNSGVAYHRAKDLPRSHRYLNQCVIMGSSLDASYRASLSKVVVSIETKLATGDFTPIDISLEPPSAIVVIEGGKPYDEEIVGGGRIWVPYGTYRLAVRADGYDAKTEEINAKSHDAMPLRVTLEKAKPQIEKPIEKPIVTPTFVDEPRPSKIPAIVASAAAGAVGIAAATFYIRARGYAKDAESPNNTMMQFEKLHDKAHSNQRVSWVLGGIAGAGAVVAGVLWYRALKTPARVEVTASGTVAGVSVVGRF